MNGEYNIITLIALIVAVVAILKLRNVLGQRTDEDDQRVERLKTRDRDGQPGQTGGSTGEVITLPRRDRDERDEKAVPVSETAASSRDALIRAYPAIDASVTDGLLAVAKADTAFEPEAFLAGSGRAYEMIVSAFADGDRKALKNLLSRDVYEGFVSAIGEREKLGEKLDQQFVGIKKSDIVDAEVRNGTALVTVRFVSELISARLDKAGAVIEGDPQKIKDVTDIWTFSRDVSSARARSNLNWRLEETQSPN